MATDYKKMSRMAADIRIEAIHALAAFGYGHVGGSISIADVLGVLYAGVMNVRPEEPKWEERDRLVLSKGHCGPGLYAALAIRGFFPKEALLTMNKLDTMLPSHCDMLHTPGIDMSTGSLGQGISSAVGIAFACRLKGLKNYTYCIIGDGECGEGQVWEAVEAAAYRKLDRLIVFVDWNKIQLDGKIKDILDPIDLEAKFRAFGCDARTVKGYDAEQIYEGIAAAKSVEGKPHVIILDTYKGLGCSFAEKASFNHAMAVDDKMADEAIAEIERRWENGTFPKGDFTW